MIKVSTLTRNASHEGKPHQHLEGQLFIIKKGLLVLHTEMGRWVMPSQRAGWIPPRCKHHAKSYGPMSGVSFYLSSKLCKTLPKHPCVFTPNSLLNEVILRCAAWQMNSLTIEKKRLIQVMIDELSTLTPQPLYLPMPHEPRLEKMAQALIANPAKSKTVKEWMECVNMTVRTFTRHFREETGMSFTKWCQLARVMKAMEYLANGKSVTWVSLTLGYQSVSAFIKVFRHLTGDTPAQYLPSLRQK